jgi:hypothetical protein
MLRMLNVLAHGDDMHRLERPDGTLVGWIRDRTIGLHGVGDERHAITAACAAWRALDAALGNQHPGWPRHEPVVGDVHITRDEQHEWIADTSRRLARLLRLGDAPPGAGGFVLEFDLPSWTTLGTLVSAAQSMGRATEDAAAAEDTPSDGLRSPHLLRADLASAEPTS